MVNSYISVSTVLSVFILFILMLRITLQGRHYYTPILQMNVRHRDIR